MLAQSPAARPPVPSFEVATIKPTPPDYAGGRFITMQTAHRFVVMNYTLKSLVAAAYDLNPHAVSGGPKWIDSDHYDILAATSGDLRPNYSQQMSMLRTLLAERFQLTLHREQKIFPVYLLSIAKGGSKLKESASPSDAAPVVVNRIFPGRVLLPARNATMTDFATVLQRVILDRSVIDKTALNGRFDFDLEWLPDERQFGGALRLMMTSDASGLTDLFTALQRQLGLRLEATRGPISALVIDRLERPSAN
jgi:uncharacterized protein (TIGR03435 family)